MKKWVISSVIGLAVLMTACGKTTSTSSKAKVSNEPSATKLLKQTEDAQTKKANVHMVYNSKVSSSEAGAVKIGMVSDINFKPAASLSAFSMKDGKDLTAYKIYVAGKKVYVAEDDEWYDASTSSSAAKTFSNMANIGKTNAMQNLSQKILKRAQVTSDTNNYNIKIDLTDSEANEAVKAGANLAAADLPNVQLSKLSVSQLTYAYQIDKKSKLPKKLTVTGVEKYKDGSDVEKLKETISVIYSKWGQSPALEPKLAD
ncbi:DUF6612 family protein [Lacticaseibacillus brantae]|uniref:Lipoprotein n=1 Tax=Lacticaseibacillus brantae DSM 23927 TaxID=1423727 RepID=A0A0R2AW99_9LACO|nr:DUF6612 family protein [Lacticaseibacillus brantae]KRM71729.1 hypothetical protein FC34_GL001388 [Lacticaseibacillus brantae DSM 23927]